ncbi:21712_t:CDS:2, partial [Dentiscutata erythropus]
MNYSGAREVVINGYTDFRYNNKYGYQSYGQGVSIELKYISTGGLLRARHKGTKNSFGTSDHEKMNIEVERKNKEALLNMPYKYYLTDDGRYIKTTIKVVLENGVTQLKSYIKVIEKGKVTKYNDMGIIDDHINTLKTKKPCVIHEFVVLVIGFWAVLWRQVDG